MAEHDEWMRRTLQRIADCLGIPVEAFDREAGPAHLRDASALLRLWDELRTDEGRRRALDALRRIVDEEAK